MPSPTAPRRCPVCGLELPDPCPQCCPRPSCGVAFLPCDGGPARPATFRLVGHYSLFVLPFALPETEGNPARRVAESGRWRQRVFSATDPDDVDRTEYFLPYVRRFLFPTLYELPGAKKDPQAEPTCRHFAFDLARVGAGPKGIELTLRCRDAPKKIAVEQRLRLTRAELVLSRFRVGFLVLRVECADAGATVFDQMDAAAYLRTIAPLYRGFEMPQLDTGAARYGVPQLLSYLLAEFGAGPPGQPEGGPETVPAGTPLPVRPIYDDRMMVYTFSCLDRETCLPDPVRSQALLHRAAVVNFDPESSTPQHEQTGQDADAWLRTRWQGFSKDGGSLVVFNTDPFHEHYAGLYHGTYYFDIFLLATLQRVTLLTLFERLADIQGLTRGGGASRRLLRRVRRDLLLFKNQCWFSQITNRERGLVLWKKWQKTLETRVLFKEVNEQSAELDTYLQTRYRERMERLLRVGGFLVAAVPFVWGLDTFFGMAEWARVVRWVALVALVLGSAAVAGYLLFWRSEEE
jgi:hypothetical protein